MTFLTRLYVLLTSRQTGEPSLLSAIIVVLAVMGSALLGVELVQR